MDVFNLSDHNSILNNFMAELRNIEIQNDRMKFRKNIERVGEIIAYEISKTLSYKEKEISSPLGISKTNVLREQLVLSPVLRAGIPLHQGFLNYFNDSENAFVSAYREYNEDHSDFDIIIEYLSAPRIEGKTLIIIDPMLATGSSMELAYNALLRKGCPSKIHLACVIASRQGIESVKDFFPKDKTTIWAGAIDPDLDEHSYIVPGLGDAGDLCYGEKDNKREKF